MFSKTKNRACFFKKSKKTEGLVLFLIIGATIFLKNCLSSNLNLSRTIISKKVVA
jgi:hypothetical protein